MPSATLSDEDFINKSLLASLNAENIDDDDNNNTDHSPPHTDDDSHFPPKNLFPHKNLNYRASFTSYPNTTRARLNSLYEPFSSQIPSTHYDPRASYDYNPPPNKPFLADQYPIPKHQPYPQQPQYSNNPIQLSSQTPYGPHLPSAGSNSSQPVPPGLTSSVSMSMVNGTNNTSSGEEISTIFVVGFPEDMQEREFQNMFTFSQGFEAATLKIPNKEYTAYGSIIGGPPGGTLRGAAGFQYAGPNDPYNIVTVNQGGVVVDGGRDGTMASWPAAAPADDLSNNLFIGGPGSSAGGMGLAGAGNSTLNVPRKQIIGFAKFRSREEALTARDILQGRRVDIEKGAVLKAEMAKKNLHTKRGVGPVPGAGVGLGVLSQQQQQHVNGMDTYNSESFSNVGMMTNSQASNRDSMPMLARLGGRDSIVNLHQQAQLQSISQSEYPGANVNGAIDTDDRFNRAGGVAGLNMGGLSLLPSGTGPLSSSSVSPNVAAATVAGSQIGLVSQQRGPRERAEEEEQWRRRGRDSEREREAQEKEANLMRLRANNAAAFDAFHGLSSSMGSTTSLSSLSGVNGNGNGSSTVGPSLMSRQNSTASTTSLSSGSGGAAVRSASSPLLGGVGDDVGYFHALHQTSSSGGEPTELNGHLQEERDDEDPNALLDDRDVQHQQDEIVGPWGRVSKATTNQAIKSTESERSTSPPIDDRSPQSQPAQTQGRYQYQPQYMHLHEQQQQFQSNLYHQQKQQLPQQYRGSSQSDTSETGSVVGGEPSSMSVNASSTNPIGYVGARLGFVTGNNHSQNQGSGLQQQQPVQSPVAQAQPLFAAQTLFARGLSGYMSPVTSSSSSGAGGPSITTAGISNNTSSESGASAASSANTNPSIGGGVNANTNTSAGGSGSTSASGSGGNTSPTLPSPASASGSGSTTSITSAGTNGNGTGSSSARGTVDQNPPINTLYVGNLPTSPPPIGYPSDYLEETLREIFSVRPGYRKLCFRHKANGPMCFVEFEDVHFAAKALQEMSGNTLRGAVKNGIRLSYSKNPLGVRTPTSAGSNTGGPTLQQQQQLMQTLNNHQQFSSGNNHHQNGVQDSYQSSRVSEDFGPPPPMSRAPLPASIMRRDSSLSSTGPTLSTPSYLNNNNGNGNGGGNGGTAYNSFFSSPPPRFYTTSNMSFGTTTSTQLTGASSAFVPRSAAAIGAATATANGNNHNSGGVMFNSFGFGGVSSQASSFSPFSVSAIGGDGSYGSQQPSQIPHLQPLAIPGGGDSHPISHHHQQHDD